MIKPTSTCYAQKLIECCKPNVFCAYEFLIWLFEDDKTYFKLYVKKHEGTKYEVQELYTYPVLFGREWFDIMTRFIENNLATLHQSFGIHEVIYDMETIKRRMQTNTN